jgi:hypothetical protein
MAVQSAVVVAVSGGVVVGIDHAVLVRGYHLSREC